MASEQNPSNTEPKKTLSLGNKLGLKSVSDMNQRSTGVSVEVKRRRLARPHHEEGSKDQAHQNLDEANQPHLSDLTHDELNVRMRALKSALQKKDDEKIEDTEVSSAEENISTPEPSEEVVELPAQDHQTLEPVQPIAQEQSAAPQPPAPPPVFRQQPLKRKKLSLDELLAKGTVVFSHEPEKKKLPPKQEEAPVAKEEAAQPAVFVDEPSQQNKRREHASKVDKFEVQPKKVTETKSSFSKRLDRRAIDRALSGDEERTRSEASYRRARQKQLHRQVGENEDAKKVVREVIVPEVITVSELSNRMAERSADVIKTLMRLGMMVTINQVIDADTAELICQEFGHKAKRVNESDIEKALIEDQNTEAGAIKRCPIVTVMGHVDHGKTSLLDALRSTTVASGEAGGITQHIGAYQVTAPSGEKITFIDTPGHAAFSEMRARGANITDIVILVVAADDGIMEQTVEALNHAKAAGVPIVIAINKIDKPDANIDKVKADLLSHDIVLEEFGGDIMSVPVSAKAKTNLDKLEETILLQAEMLNLKANPNVDARGVVVEAQIDRGRGMLATVLIRQGTLRVGDIFVTGAEYGKVRAMTDDHGRKIQEATPGMPVEILGLNGVPMAGDDFAVVASESQAREIAEFRGRRHKEQQIKLSAKTSMEHIMSGIQNQSISGLPVVIKADVQGSLEAIASSLLKLNTDEVAVKILHSAVGAINESDVTLAGASGGMIVGFNVRANPQARDLSKLKGVDLRYYSIIYNVVDDVKALMSGLLAPTLQEKFLGTAEIREIFSVPKVGKVAGCYITQGIVKRGAKLRLLRDNVVIHEGNLKTLRRFKDEVKEVKESFECGVAFESYQDIKIGDIIECMEVEEIKREL